MPLPKPRQTEAVAEVVRRFHLGFRCDQLLDHGGAAAARCFMERRIASCCLTL